jgi:hypothetical protein
MMSKDIYFHEIKQEIFVDVYDVLLAFKVINPAVQHAIKKLLVSGERGYKSTVQDLNEAIISINRAIEIEKENMDWREG